MTEPEKLTEAEAWREIARLFAEGEADSGMCWEVLKLRWDDKITFVQQQDMKQRINRHAADSWIYGVLIGPWAFEEDDKEVRVLAALFLALEAEEETILNEPCEACGEIHGGA